MAILPIGGVFTMDAYQAAEAVKLIKPKLALPIQYASFPIIAKTADGFIKECREKDPNIKVAAIAVGESLTI